MRPLAMLLALCLVPACKRSEPSPSATGASCDAKVEALGSWLTRLVGEGEFRSSLGEVVTSPLAKTDLPPTWIEGRAGDLAVANGSISFNGSLLARSEEVAMPAAVVELRRRLAQTQKLGQALGHTATTLVAVVLASDARWKDFVDLATLAEGAGQSELLVLVEAAASQVPPPPHSMLTERLKQISRGAAAVSPEEKKQILATPQKSIELERCKPALDLHEQLANEPHSQRTKMEKLARETPARLRACSCNADIDAVQTRAWAVLNRFYGAPATAVRLSIAKSGQPLAFPADQQWQTVIARMVELSKSKQAVAVAIAK